MSKEISPFSGSSKVVGVPLVKYLAWAAGYAIYTKKLLLPPIQRGFVWKPLQIVTLWDSLLRGMPIGSLMLSDLKSGDEATTLNAQNRQVSALTDDAFGLMDGQQRTLAMLLGWQQEQASHFCIWIDLGEHGVNGAPFELRITSRTQPFGYQRHTHGKMSRQDRRDARSAYDAAPSATEASKKLQDYQLFDTQGEAAPVPWKGSKHIGQNTCVRLNAVWSIFSTHQSDANAFAHQCKDVFVNLCFDQAEANLLKLHKALVVMTQLEVPLLLIPTEISKPEKLAPDVAAPLTLLFERIGTGGTALSPSDLLFSMIKQQWPDAHTLVEKIHNGNVKYLMSATDYVMTAFRLASAEHSDQPNCKNKIADNPRPSAHEFHRNLADLISESGILRRYIQDESPLVHAFNELYATLKFNGTSDIGLPDMMLPYLSRGLIQVLLRWFMLNTPSAQQIAENRANIIAFSLFWYLCVLNEDKASKLAFSEIKRGKNFPSSLIYQKLSDIENGRTGLALQLVLPERLKTILEDKEPAVFRLDDEIFKRGEKDGEINVILATIQERDLYKRFFWFRKPVLLWLQREYVQREFGKEVFAGITDEDAVPYDFDHLCPQHHWAADWRNVNFYSEQAGAGENLRAKFYRARGDVGNSIGNLHVLDSSLNRSFGDDPLETKLLAKGNNWRAEDSLIFCNEAHKALWLAASPDLNDDAINKKAYWAWSEARMAAFQQAVSERALFLYQQYFEACLPLLETN